jgi:SAM-dependent methyltransferase
MVRSILMSGTDVALDASLYHELKGIVDQSSLDAKSPELLAQEAFVADANNLLDFGCGTGQHRDMLEKYGYRWSGVNYLEGMASGVRELAAADDSIQFYDGLHLPYETASFDVVYSFQTFEHVQNIATSFSEIERVLKPSGRLIGAVSYLEQIHDYSTYNFTPYGLKLAANGAGLKLERLYPSFDVFTWMFRRLLIVTSGEEQNSLTDSLGRANSIHQSFADYGVANGLDVETINMLRIMFSSHLTFQIAKSAA